MMHPRERVRRRAFAELVRQHEVMLTQVAEQARDLGYLGLFWALFGAIEQLAAAADLADDEASGRYD